MSFSNNVHFSKHVNEYIIMSKDSKDKEIAEFLSIFYLQFKV